MIFLKSQSEVWALLFHLGGPCTVTSISSMPCCCKTFTSLNNTLASQLLFPVSFLQSSLCLLSVRTDKHLKGRLSSGLLCNSLCSRILPSESQTLWQFRAPICFLSPRKYSNRVTAIYILFCELGQGKYEAHLDVPAYLLLRIICIGHSSTPSNDYCVLCLAFNSCSQWDSWFNISYSVMAGIKSFSFYNLAHFIL